jgi:hypothetical protein
MATQMKVANEHGTEDIVASFQDEQAAAVAIARLEATGVSQTRMSTTRVVATPPSEMPTMKRVFWSGLWWSVLGAVVGAGLGLLVGLLDLGIPGSFESTVLQVASWAMFFHVLGALLGCYLVLDTGDRFASKEDHHDVELVLIRVAGVSRADASAVEDALRSFGGNLEAYSARIK